MEAIVATVIAVIAVLGLAYSFGLGRSFIDGFQERRVAGGAVQACMDSLGTLPATAAGLSPGVHPATPRPFVCYGRTLGTLSWKVAASPTGLPPGVTTKLRLVTATVTWAHNSLSDSVSYSRLVLGP